MRSTLYLRTPEKARKAPKGALDELSRAAFRYRVELLPLLILFIVYALTTILGPRVPWLMPVILISGAGAMYRYGKRIDLPNYKIANTERIYLTTVLALLGIWSACAVFWSADAKPSLRWSVVLVLGTPFLAYPWLRHRRIRGSVRVTFEPNQDGTGWPSQRAYRKWLRSMEDRARLVVTEWDSYIRASAAAGSRLVSIHFDRWSVECGVRLAHARVAEDFTELRLRRLESAFLAKRDSARVDYVTGGTSRDAKIKFMFTDPHATPIIPTEDDLTGDYDLTVDIGRFEDMRHVIIDLIHTLIAGASGAGKSAVINAIMRGLSRKPNVAIVGIDLKPGGLELGKWRDVMYALATTGAEAKTLLDAIIAGIGRRGHIMNARGIRKWVPTVEEPFVVLVIDEVQSLKEYQLFPKLTKISELSRAYGFAMFIATQHPKETSVPTSAIANCTQRIGLQCNASTAERLIFDDNATREGWRLTKLPGDREGTFLVKSKRHRRPMRARSHWLDDTHVDREAARFKGFRTAIDVGTWHGIEVDDDVIAAIEPPDDGDDVIDVSAVIIESSPDDLVLMAIASGHGTPTKIASMTEIPIRSVKSIIRRLAGEGKIAQDGERKPWKLTGV